MHTVSVPRLGPKFHNFIMKSNIRSQIVTIELTISACILMLSYTLSN